MRKMAMILIIGLLLVSAMIVGCGKTTVENTNTTGKTPVAGPTPADIGSSSDPVSNTDVDTGSLY
jgi:hypothetical protein